MILVTPKSLLLASCSSSLLSFIILLLLQSFFQTSQANNNCTPSACGILPNITSPFRLSTQPKNCGDGEFEISCENGVASMYIYSRKYYVKAIDYEYGELRVVDAAISNVDACSFPDTNLALHLYFSPPFFLEFLAPINLISCPFPLNIPNSSSSSSILKDITHDCEAYYSNSSNPTTYRYTYLKFGTMSPSEFPYKCRLERIGLTSPRASVFTDAKNASLSEIHDTLLYGFLVRFCQQPCGERSLLQTLGYLFEETSILVFIPLLMVIIGLLCAGLGPPTMAIFGFVVIFGLLVYNLYSITTTNIIDLERLLPAALPRGFTPANIRELSPAATAILVVLSSIIFAPRFIIFPLAIWFLIYKYRRRHLSAFEGIESFLQSDNKLTSIGYSYSDIKKMTRNFQDKLGQGGYGTVYKGKLRSGHDVAVKLLKKSEALRKSGANDQDFINEIGTIGRIHHINVVKLVGYCAQGSKRALIYDFMPNGSLEKYLFGREKMNSLNWDTKFEIAIGIARGIEYLHRGCDIQILHFDIKPHNILLDDQFIPKISDFGLAKFYSTDKKTVTMTNVRGTIGYMAPELNIRSIGDVSYKADVYSFGMLLIEIVGLNRNLKGNNDDKSQYFPNWIYDSYKQGKDIEIQKVNEDDENEGINIFVKKMTIVALWCIQLSPDNRPSMNNVLQMLEGDVERLQIPDYSSDQPPQSVVDANENEITCSSDSISLLHHNNTSLCVEIAVQE